MKINHIYLENFLSYKEEKVDLSNVKVASIVGENGAGKSTLLDAVMYALFGISRAGTDDELIRLGQEQMRVELSFKMMGTNYLVKRGRTKGAGTKLIFSSDEQELSGATMKETQTSILAVLKMNSNLFTSSAFILQGKFDEFIRKTSAEKKKILMDALDLGRFEEYENRVREKQRDLKSSLDQLSGSLQRLEMELEQHKDVDFKKEVEHLTTIIKTKEEFILRKEADITSLKLRKQKIEEQQSTYLERRKQLQDLEKQGKETKVEKLEQENKLDSVVERCKSIVKKIGVPERVDLPTNASTLDKCQVEMQKQLKQISLEISIQENNLTKFLADKRNMEREVKELQAGIEEGVCPTCGQSLSNKVSIERKIAFCSENLQILQKGIEKSGELKNKLEISSLRWEYSYSLLLQGFIKDKVGKIEERLTSIRDEYKKLRDFVGNTTTLEEEMSGVNLALQNFDRDIRITKAEKDDAVRKLGSIEEVQKKVKEWKKALVLSKERKEQLNRLAVVLDSLQVAFSKKGIPNLIIRESIPYIQDESNKLLERFGGQFKVEFVSKEDKAESLEMYAEDEMGRREISMDSGGEVVRIALATRVALSRLLMSRSQSQIKLLILDEPSFLDDKGIGQLVEVLGYLSEDFDQILVISHLEDLTNVFDKTIMIRKTLDGSKVVIQ